MEQVKIFTEMPPNSLEKKINEWLEEKGDSIVITSRKLTSPGVSGNVFLMIFYRNKKY